MLDALPNLRLKEAENALRDGDIDEAFGIVTRKSLSAHRRARQILRQLGEPFLKRAKTNLSAGRLDEALADVRRAEIAQPDAPEIAELRQETIKAGIRRCKTHLDRAERVLFDEQLASLAPLKTKSPDLTRMIEATGCWHAASRSLDKGRYEAAADELAKLLAIFPDLAWAQEEKDRLERIVSSMRELRRGPLAMPNGASIPTNPRAAERGAWPSFVLRVDGTGSFLVVTKPRAVIGQKAGEADVQLLAGISSRHAEIVRTEDEYFLTAHRPTNLDGKAVERALLHDGSSITFGAAAAPAVAAEFRVPSKMTPTAVLSFASDARLADDVKDVILMANALIVSSRTNAHARVTHADCDAAIFLEGEKMFCQSESDVEVDGRSVGKKAEVFPGSRVGVGELSFCLEETT